MKNFSVLFVFSNSAKSNGTLQEVKRKFTLAKTSELNISEVDLEKIFSTKVVYLENLILSLVGGRRSTLQLVFRINIAGLKN